MDMTQWLWERVERRDAPAVLAHALSLAPTRDALLRHAAISQQWDLLAIAAEEAADVARDVGWSRSGPDVVAAICGWIRAERTLRSVAQADLAAPLAASALAAWDAPADVARRLAAVCPLTAEDAAAFEQALSEEPNWLQSVDDVHVCLRGGPDVINDLISDDHTRTTLLRHAARTGDWQELASLAAEAQHDPERSGPPSSPAEDVAQLAAWMLGHRGEPQLELRTRPRIAEALSTMEGPSAGQTIPHGGDDRLPVHPPPRIP